MVIRCWAVSPVLVLAAACVPVASIPVRSVEGGANADKHGTQRIVRRNNDQSQPDFLLFGGVDCVVSDGETIGEAAEAPHLVQLAVGRNRALAAWVAPDGRLLARALDLDGSSIEPAQANALPGVRAVQFLAALDDHYVAFVQGPGWVGQLLRLDARGSLTGEPLRVGREAGMAGDHIYRGMHVVGDDVLLVAEGDGEYTVVRFRYDSEAGTFTRGARRQPARLWASVENINGHRLLESESRHVVVFVTAPSDGPNRLVLYEPEEPTVFVEAEGAPRAAVLVGDRLHVLSRVGRQWSHAQLLLPLAHGEEPEEVAVVTGELPEPFAEYLEVELQDHDGELTLDRRDARRHRLGERLTLGSLGSVRHRRHYPSGDFAWAGTHLLIARTSPNGETTTVRTQSVRCPHTPEAE